MKSAKNIFDIKIKMICIIMTVVIATVMIWPVSVMADGDKCMAENITLTVNDTDIYNVKAVCPYYDNNTYLSLRDMANAFAGTDKAFDVSVASDSIVITTGTDYQSPGIGNDPFDQAAVDEVYGLSYTLKINSMKIDGREVKYFSLIGSVGGVYDAFISTTDFALIFDTDMWYRGDDLYADTKSDYVIDIDILDKNEYFSLSSGALVGDATTGDILYEYEGDKSLPIASTTKLMTYLVVMDAVSKGSISMDDSIVISEKAEWLSGTSDGVVALTAGTVTNIQDMLCGMMIASSNECALVLAEHVAGTEQLFVDMMNTTAAAIGLSDETVFYNCNGLPVYSEDMITSKNQNHMTCEDMFKLCSYIINRYPQITDITTLKSTTLSSVGAWVANTNSLLYNMPECIGLKTGTTNKAGACLVSAATVNVDGTDHTIIAVELGAENQIYRITVSQVLLTYGIQYVLGETPSHHDTDVPGDIPVTAEGLCSLIVNAAREKHEKTEE